MTDSSIVHSENVSGPFSINSLCISCSACWELAPDFIQSHEIHTYAYFYKQPKNLNDTKTCQLALKICPVNAIKFTKLNSSFKKI